MLFCLTFVLFFVIKVLQALQSHTELSRARLYPDPSTFMPNRSDPDFVDHGDVDMRQQQQQPSIPPIIPSQPTVSVAPSSLPATDDKLSLVTHVQATFPSTDSTTASSGSTTLTSSSKIQEEPQIPASTVPITSNITPTTCQQNHPITSSGFTLAEVSFNKCIFCTFTSLNAKHNFSLVTASNVQMDRPKYSKLVRLLHLLKLQKHSLPSKNQR